MTNAEYAALVAESEDADEHDARQSARRERRAALKASALKRFPQCVEIIERRF